MKPGKTWLRTALRAQEMRRHEQQHHVHEAWGSLLEAAERERQAGSRLAHLSVDWATQRGGLRCDAPLEVLYQRFDVHLRGQADLAVQARVAGTHQWEAAAAELGRVHSAQRLLERVAARDTAEQCREAAASEARLNAEAWLFGRIARREDEPEPGDAYAPRVR